MLAAEKRKTGNVLGNFGASVVEFSRHQFFFFTSVQVVTESASKTTERYNN
jgi:hypothetical protein